MKDWEEYLTKLYFDPKQRAAFGGPEKLYQVVKKEGLFKLSLRKIKLWLQKQDAYSLHRPARYRFKRLKVITSGIDDLWDADLADVSNLARYNQGIRFLLIVIDVFTRFLWVVPLEDKSSKTVMTAFTEVFSGGRRPNSIRCDKGSEFTNRWLKAFMKKTGVYLFFTKNEVKANYAERVIRTLKTMMFRYFTHNQTYKYTDVLADLVKNYNNRPHGSLGGSAPDEVDRTNEAVIWKKMYVDTQRHSRTKAYKFKVGSMVRISHVKYTFQRDYQEKWTEEIFTIAQRFRRRDFSLQTQGLWR